jgi:nicotinate phosphoribosyltransferase
MSKSLLVDLYELTMAQVYFKHKRNVLATFDLFIRSRRRPFYVACGIDDVLNYIQDLRFSKEDIDYLKSLAIFEDEFLDYLKNFRFKGDIWGIEEPEIIFAQEPILRISGSLIEAQIIESIILNKINLATTLATKAARVVIAAKGRGVYDFSLRRTQGEEASLAAAKYSYMVGAKGTSNVYAGFLYNIPVVGTMAHSFVMSFEREIDSFLAFTLQFPTKSILLIDTYNIERGITSAIKVAKFLKRRGFELLGIRIDSGDLTKTVKYVRSCLDREGLVDTFIFVSGNLDEYKIDKLIKENVPVDAFGVGTNMGCSSDLPYTDVIYKLVEIKERGKDFIPTMKLSEGKTTLPSKKQIFRIFNKNGFMEKDYIELERERICGKKILKKLMNGGRRTCKEKSLEEKREIFLEKIKKVPPYLKKLDSVCNYPVKIGKQLSLRLKGLKEKIEKRISPKIVFVDIDTQYDFLDKKGALYVKNSESILKNLKLLTNFAKKHRILILSSQDTHRKEDPEFEQFSPHCIKGTWGHKKIKETLIDKYKIISFKKSYSSEELRKIVEKFNQIILEKSILNVFSNPNTLKLLEIIFPEEVYVYGVVTEYCIKEAVNGFLKWGFSVVVIEDAIKEISSKEKDKLFSIWKKKGVKFIKTRYLLDHFQCR